MSSRQVQRTVLVDEEPVLDRLWDIRQTSVCQASQTRFYVAEARAVTPHVSLFVGGLPPGLSPQDYSNLLHEAMATKAAVVSVSHVYSLQGAVVLDVTCFAEAERLYMLARDTAVHGRPLTALVLPDVLHTKLPSDCCPLLVFVNPKSGGLKGRELLCSFRKLLNPHQVFELTNGGPLPGCPAFGYWSVVEMAPWAGCSLPWRRQGAIWPAQSHLWPSYPWVQGMTLAGSSVGEQAIVVRTHFLCWCLWMRLMLCSWIDGQSCWMLMKLIVQRTMW